MSGSHILDRQNPIIFFRHNFTKKYIFPKVPLVSDSTRSDISKELIKIYYLCKNALELSRYVTTGTKCQVQYSMIIIHNVYVYENSKKFPS